MGNNIKGITRNSLEYTGIVTLSKYIKGKKQVVAEIHNAGGKPLFNFLTDCLVGDFDTARLDRPNKILLLNKSVSSDGDEEIIQAEHTGFIYLLTKPEKVYSSKQEGIVKYSFIIPQEYFIGTSFNAIGLYTGTASDPSAYAAICEIGRAHV